MTIEQRLVELGIELDPISQPMGNYVPAVQAHGLVFCAGASCVKRGKIVYTGTIGDNLTIADGYDAARLAAISVLAKLKYAVGDLDRIDRIVKLVAHMRTTADFTQHAKVTDGASDLLAEVFGTAAPHARLSLGVATLPVELPLEIELVASIK